MRRYALLVLFGLALLVHFMVSNQPLNIYDEGLVLYGAERVLKGELPYRDFWTIYAPGQFYVLAGLFSVFGSSVFVERIWDMAVKVALSIIVYSLARTLLSTWLAFLASSVVVLWLGSSGFAGYPMFPALAASLASVVCVLRFCGSGRIGWLVTAGTLSGLATLFRHDVGAYTFVTEFLVLGVRVRTLTALLGRPDRSLPAWRTMALTLYGLGVAVIVVPVSLYLIWHVPLAALWHHLFVFPATILPNARSLPYPSIIPGIRHASLQGGWHGWLGFYLPLTVYAWAGLSLGIHLRREGSECLKAPATWAVALLTGLGLALFFQALSRFDPIHFLPTAIPATLLITHLLSESTKRTIQISYKIAVGVAILAISTGWVAVPAKNVWKKILSSWPPLCGYPLQRSGCLTLPEGQRQAIQFLQIRTGGTEKVLSGVSRHDRVFINDIALYFLANRHSSSKYHEFSPGQVTEAAIQREIVDRLQADQVTHIVLYTGVADSKEPNLSSISSGVSILDDFIHSQFSPIATFGEYTIWVRLQHRDEKRASTAGISG